MAFLLIHPNMPCVVVAEGKCELTSTGSPARLICVDNGIVTVDALYGGKNIESDALRAHIGMDRYSFVVGFEKGKAVWSCGCELIDWGEFYEAYIDISEIRSANLFQPRVLCRLDGRFDKYSKIMMIKEDTVKLYAEDEKTGEQLCWIVGCGDEGELSVVNAANKTFLAVKTEGETVNNGRRGERLILADGGFNTMLDVTADLCGVAEGSPYKIKRLDSLEGYELRSTYAFNGGAWKENKSCIGFFTRERTAPHDNAETSLAFVQSAGFQMFDEARKYLADELSDNLSNDEIADFIGSFEKAIPKPSIFDSKFQKGIVQIGLIRNKDEILADVTNPFTGSSRPIAPEVYEFEFRNGKIADINEI